MNVINTFISQGIDLNVHLFQLMESVIVLICVNLLVVKLGIFAVILAVAETAEKEFGFITKVDLTYICGKI